MERTVELGVLFAYYGAFLTERQREILSLRVDDDYSLGEIAERESISRQGVYDMIRRAQTQLYDMEKKLMLVERSRAMECGLRRIEAIVENLKINNNDKERLLKETAALHDIWEDEYGV